MRDRHLTSRLGADLVVVAVVFLTTMLLYAPSLRYPFVWYDADDLLRAVKYSTENLFAGVANYQYYRPLIFVFWKLILNTWGADSAPMFHAYLIGAHVLNGVLLYALTRALTRSRPIAAAAALLFAVYPFSYQAVTWIIAHQPPSLIFVLAGLLIYTKARGNLDGARRGIHLADGQPRLALFVFALVLLVIAMLLHESAYVSAGLIVLIEAYLALSKRVSRISLWPLAYIGVTGVMYLIYASATKSSAPQATFEVQTGLYLLQGLVHPAAMLLARACQPASCDPIAWLLPVGLIFLAALIVFWRWQRTQLIGLFGLLWFLAGILPMWAGRDFVYHEYAPRLVYLAGAGACIAIAAVVGQGVEFMRRGHSGRRRFALGCVALILLQGSLFVFRRQSLHDEALDLLEQENAAMFAPREGKALFINAVELFTFEDAEFPLGWFGVLVSPWHNRIVTDQHLRALNAEWVIEPAHAQLAQDRARVKLEFHGQPLPPDPLQTAILSAAQVFRVDAPQTGLHLFQIGQIEHHAPPPDSFLAAWPGDVRLISATIDREAGVPVLNLDWFSGGPIDRDQTVFVHIIDEAGQVTAQADGDLVGGNVPIGLWAKNDRVQERRPLIDLPPGQYTIALGLYNRNSLQRLAPTRSNAPARDDAVFIGTLTQP